MLDLTSVYLPQLFHRGQSGEMALFSFLILTLLCIVGREALRISDCEAFARRPGKTIMTFNLALLFWTEEVILILVQV